MIELPLFQNTGMVLDLERRKAFNEFNEMVYSGIIKIDTVDICFCGNRNFQLLSRYDRFGLPFGTKICKTCGLITQTLRIQPDSLPCFYENIYWPLVDSRNVYLTPQQKFVKAIPYIINNIPSSWENISIFEIGCGSGEKTSLLMNKLKQNGFFVSAIGCDYSTQALGLAARKNISTVHGGIDKLLEHGKPDILIMSHVFEHFPDLKQALAQIDKLTNDDTLVYIEVPGVIDLENKSEYSFDYQDYSVLAHTYNFSLSTLTQVMSSQGFKLLQGDEYIRAVFKKGNSNRQFISDYKQIIEALKRAYNKHLKFENRRNQKIMKYFRNIAKALLGRIE